MKQQRNDGIMATLRRLGRWKLKRLLVLLCAAITVYIIHYNLPANQHARDKHLPSAQIQSELLFYRFRHRTVKPYFGSHGKHIEIGDTSKKATKGPSGNVSRTMWDGGREGVSIFPPYFIESLESVAQNRTLVISLVDKDFVDFAVNFYELSIEALKLGNFVLVCMDRDAERSLKRQGLHCMYLALDTAFTNETSDFGTNSYYQKTNIKTLVMLEMLKLNYNVLMTDLDVVLFKDPFPHFQCADCDIHIQMDRELYNSGFVYARPTGSSLRLYQDAWRLYRHYHKSHDQAYINMAIRELLRNNSINVHELSRRTFSCGHYYFQDDGRMFGNQPPCPECVMAHNNYIGSVAAKVYRFKENLLWRVDADGYYSDPTNKYVAYENTVVFDSAQDQMRMERQGLMNALYIGRLLGRILILPTFRCCDCQLHKCDLPKHRCSLLSVLRLKTFDEVFGSKYREHVFLQHTKVPKNLKSSVSELLHINSSVSPVNGERGSTTFHPANTSSGPTEQELVKWFKSYQNVSILRFSTLYGPFQFSDAAFIQKAQGTMECTNYEQWDKALNKFP